MSMQDAPDGAVTGTAVVYTRKGGPEVIGLIERSVRAPVTDEVRITVAAAAVNPADVFLRETGFRPGYGGQSYPIVPGLDAAGVIETVGPGVSHLRVGQEVMACVGVARPEGGAQAQHIVVPAASVVVIPDRVSLAQACTLPMTGLTALRVLELAGLREGQVLAVSGGAGLLARYAIAVAKRRSLFVVADAKPEDTALVRSYGADIVIERGDAFAEAVRRDVRQGVDAFLDAAVLGKASFGAIRDGGVYIPVRFWQDEPGERGIAIKPVSVFEVFARPDRTEWLELLRDMASAGEIELPVAAEHRPDQAREAQRMIEDGGVRGRPVILF